MKHRKIRLLVFLLFLISSLVISACDPSSVVSSASQQNTSPSISAKATTSTPSMTPTPSKTPVPTPSVSDDISGNLVVHFLNVGQGDSEYIELPNGQTILIDAGNPGDGIKIAQYIQGHGNKKIDFLIATHPHADHIGGMAEVVNAVNISSVYMPKVSSNTKTFEDLLTAIKAKGLSVQTAKAGVSLVDAGNLKVNIIAPNSSSYEDLNNYSAVIKITYKNNSFLFMGDAQTLSENEIISSGANVKADVLKVGHHGSDTSTGASFLKAVSPKYAVISVGAGNDYGHPKQTTLDKLKAAGASVFRTDQDGTVIIKSDGTTLTANKDSFLAISATAPSPSPSPLPSPSPSSSPSPSIAVVPLPSPSHVNISPNDDQSVTVYITKTGEKYHRAGCQYLSKSCIPITLSQAKAEGYTPCSKCHPPT